MTLSTRKIDVPEEFEESDESTFEKPNINGDRLNLFLLIILYMIQGFSIGLTGAFSLILQSYKTITYEEQAILSMALWPFFLKILWAPIIDAIYIQWIGRRKCWLLLLQLSEGVLLLYLASNIDEWTDSGKPNIKTLVVVIFFGNVLAATQDIVIDGWSLTMLKKRNLSYAAMCNSMGIHAGILIGCNCFTLFVSEQFSNTYLKTTPGTGGLVTMKSFLSFFGIGILLVTLLVGIFKKEKSHGLDKNYVRINLFQNFKILWKLLNLPGIFIFTLALMTMKFGFIVTDNVSGMKLIDAGVSKDDIMIIFVIVQGVKFVFPFFISKYLRTTKPISYLLNLVPIKLFWAAAYAMLLYYTRSIIYKDGVVHVPAYYYCLLGLVIIINEVMNFLIMLLLFAFFCRISDPRFGGTYMTLFSTIFFSGYLISKTLGIQLVPFLTFNKCVSQWNSLSERDERNCELYIDGYYPGAFICIFIGCFWYAIFRKILKKYESMEPSYWLVNVAEYNSGEVKESGIMSST